MSMAPLYAHPGHDLASEGHVVHLAACWTRYPGKRYLGGAVGVTKTVFEKLNGYPNNYWGWGGEDDELQRRCVATQTPVHRVKHGSYTDLENMSLDEKLTHLRAHPEWKNQEKWELRDAHASTWRTNGLSNLEACCTVTEVNVNVRRVFSTYFVHIQSTT